MGLGGMFVQGVLVRFVVSRIQEERTLVAAMAFEPARRMLDKLAGLSARMPFWAGVLLIVLGLWSIWFGLFATLPTST